MNQRNFDQRWWCSDGVSMVFASVSGHEVATVCDKGAIEMILSFAWTTEALLAGKKTCTRRIWSERTARSWIKACQSGRWVHQAWNNVPFVKGASKVADLRLTHLPYQQRLIDMPVNDLEAEGGLWASKEEFISLFGEPEQVVWVVRFELFRIAGVR